MEAKDYNIMYCKDRNLYINNSKFTQFRSDDSKRFSEEDLESIERWIEQNNKYICKDDFIEKAKKWFEKQNEWYDINGNRHCDMENFEDFKKYMEGK